MTLLREIQSDAINSDVSLSTLLRKSKVLAARLGHQPLSDWVESELNGYARSAPLPDYRKHAVVLYGAFHGLFQTRLQNVQLPAMSFDEEHREYLFNAYFTEGVASLEETAKSPESHLKIAVSADLVLFYQDRLMERMIWVEGWRSLSRSAVSGTLDQIRNRVLSFALEIEAANPNAGEASPGTPSPVPIQRVDQIFNTYILGGQNVVASGSNARISDFAQTIRGWADLDAELERLGIPQDDRLELKAALDSDLASGNSELGEKASSWLGRVTSRIAGGTLALPANVTANLIAEAIARYFVGSA